MVTYCFIKCYVVWLIVLCCVMECVFYSQQRYKSEKYFPDDSWMGKLDIKNSHFHILTLKVLSVNTILFVLYTTVKIYFEYYI